MVTAKSEIFAANGQTFQVVSHVSKQGLQIRTKQWLSVFRTRALVHQPALDAGATEGVLARGLKRRLKNVATDAAQESFVYSRSKAVHVIAHVRLQGNRCRVNTGPPENTTNIYYIYTSCAYPRNPDTRRLPVNCVFSTTLYTSVIYIHTYIHTYRQTDRQRDRHTYIQPIQQMISKINQ